MYHEFQESDAIEVQAHHVAECNTQSIAPITECIAQDYTVDQLAELLGVKRRQVFNLAKTVKEAYSWEPENTFNPGFGKYSDRCLVEMRRLQGCKNSAEYTALVASESQKPVTPYLASKVSSSLAIPTRHTEALESKLAIIQRNISTTSLSIQDRIATIKEQISAESSRTKKNLEVLEDAEAQQAIGRGVERGMKLFQLEEQAKAAVLEQLQLEKLQQG